MTLELIILLIILIPIVLLVILKRRTGTETKPSKIVCQILGIFMLVFGVLLLFVSFFKLFHESISGWNIALLIVNLMIVFGGYSLTNWASRQPKMNDKIKAEK